MYQSDIDLSTYIPTDPPTLPPTQPPTYFPTHPPTYLSTYLHINLPTHPSIYSPIHLLTYQPIYPPIYLLTHHPYTHLLTQRPKNVRVRETTSVITSNVYPGECVVPPPDVSRGQTRNLPEVDVNLFDATSLVIINGFLLATTFSMALGVYHINNNKL